ncbi:MAG TPA: LysR substrate-binding domain-containing protein [Burkholderiales bacterium]|jgi:DNA-binding transcriptional LysR family regulator|nr:LysR substrate-binding domain-containing protein [Burkholderiales bacterium]
MDLSDLRIFRTVAEAGGITRAAGLLHRVPSNITTRIKNLEQELGAPLFVREHKRMQLSPAGKTLLGYAQRLLALADEAREAVGGSEPRGILRLGAMESTAATRLPALLGKMHKRHPALAVELRTGNPRVLTADVLAGDLDAALVAEPVSDARLKSAPAYLEELVLVGPEGHPRIHSPADIPRSTLLVFEPGCPHRARLEDWCMRGKMAPARVVEVGSYHAILGCCVAGMGVALMPRRVLDTYTERARLSVHPLKGDFRSARTLLIWRGDVPQAKVAALAGMLR